MVPNQPNKHVHFGETIAEKESICLDSKDDEDDDFYTLQEIDNLNNKTMAYMERKFKNLIFPNGRAFKAKTSFNNYDKWGPSTKTEGANKGG